MKQFVNENRHGVSPYKSLQSSCIEIGVYEVDDNMVCMKSTVICIVKALFVFVTRSVFFKNVPQMILLFDSVGMIMNFIFNNCRNP